MSGDVIELEYNGRELMFREDDDEWYCQALKLKAKSLSSLKRKIDKLDGEARRVSAPVIIVGDRGYYSTEGERAKIVMLAKASDWESLRYDEQPEKLAGLQSRRAPTVWVMRQRGNGPAERTKVRLDNCAAPTESTFASLREVERLRGEAKGLAKAADSIIAAIPRLTIDDLKPQGVKEDPFDDD
jgi:hypothetical protein